MGIVLATLGGLAAVLCNACEVMGRRIARQPAAASRNRNHGFVGDVLLAGLLATVIVFGLAPACIEARDRARRSVCLNQLRTNFARWTAPCEVHLSETGAVDYFVFPWGTLPRDEVRKYLDCPVSLRFYDAAGQPMDTVSEDLQRDAKQRFENDRSRQGFVESDVTLLL